MEKQIWQLLEKWSENESMHTIFVHHGNCPTYILEKIASWNLRKIHFDDETWKILCEVTLHINCKKETSENLLEKIINHKKIDVLEKAIKHLRHSNCAGHLLEKLSKIMSNDMFFAKHQYCPADILEDIVNRHYKRSNIKDEHESLDILVEVATHNCCPIKLLKKLAKHKDQSVRKAVAQNYCCPLHLLKQLAKDSDYEVRCAVASHFQCPLHLLEQLAEDSNYEMQCAVAFHFLDYIPLNYLINEEIKKEMHISILENLSENESHDLTFLRHPNCPVFILKKIMNRNLTRHKPNTAEANRQGEMLYEIATHPKCPKNFLKKLAKQKYHRWVLQVVASNPKCPIYILEEITSNYFAKQDFNSCQVLCAVASNSKCPIWILEKLAKHKNQFVCRAVARNKNCPIHLLKKMSEDQSDPMQKEVARNILDNFMLSEKEAEA